MKTFSLKGRSFYFFSIFVFLSLLVPFFASAQDYGAGNTRPDYSSGNTRTPTQYAVQNPLKAKSISEFVEQILQAVVIIGIPIAILFIVFAGFKFVLAQGNPDALKLARKNLINTIIGIAIFLGAWLIAQVIYNTVKALGPATGL